MESITLQPLYATLVTGTADNVSRIIITDSSGNEVGILGGVQSAQFHTEASGTTSHLNLSIVRLVGNLESEGCLR